jgi:DNA-directed RNA polymerase specialized sigma subunit
MKILINKNGYVDFEAPIYMTDKQREYFINGMKKIFKDIQIKHIIEQIKEMPERETVAIVDWKNPKNLLLLTKGLTEEEIADKLGIGREHTFAIRLKSADFLLPFYNWARKKGLTQITEKDIEEFLQKGR